MNLSEVISQLAYGELQHTSMMSNGPDKLTDTDLLKLANSINLGMTALYKRFNLKERRVSFPLQPDLETYSLNLPDLLKITKVITDSDTELALNDEKDPYSVFTPALNYVRVPLCIVNKESGLPDILVTDSLEVVYRANHPRIDTSQGFVDVDATVLELPDSHLEALCLFVAMRMNIPMGVGQGEGFASHNYATKYENECMRLEMTDLQVEDNGTANTKLAERGFV